MTAEELQRRVGDGQRLAARHAPQFQAAAARLGIELRADVKLPWLTRHGHLAQVVQASAPSWALAAMDEILDALNGDPVLLGAKTRGAMTADFVLLPGGVQVVEYDEVQHFTTARLATLRRYPVEAPLAFRPDEYATIVDRWKAQGDKGFAHREAAEFPGRGGRQRQRAYFDALRDLIAPHFGNGAVLRVAAPADDYDAVARRLADMVDSLAA